MKIFKILNLYVIFDLPPTSREELNAIAILLLVVQPRDILGVSVLSILSFLHSFLHLQGFKAARETAITKLLVSGLS